MVVFTTLEMVGIYQLTKQSIWCEKGVCRWWRGLLTPSEHQMAEMRADALNTK